MSRDAPTWTQLLVKLGCATHVAATWAPIFAEVVKDDTFSMGDEELDEFLGNVLHESNYLASLEENLYYSTPGRLMAVWPSRFPTRADEVPYLRNPEALANKVYMGRMGNVAPGDGWRYRGSGAIGVTGADNFRAIQKLTGIPIFDHPELLRAPTKEALRVCIAWWEGHVPDSIMGNGRLVRKQVNGGVIGLDDTLRLTSKAHQALESTIPPTV